MHSKRHLPCFVVCALIQRSEMPAPVQCKLWIWGSCCEQVKLWKFSVPEKAWYRPGRPERSSTSLTVMPCHHIDVTQPNSSVPSGTPLALLLVGIWLWAVVEGSIETTQFLRSQWFFWGTQQNLGNTQIPRQRGMLIIPACCRLQLGKWKKGLVSSTTGTLAFVHQQYFKERGWVVQSSRVQVQSRCWRLKKEAFHCTSSLVLPMSWGEPSWLSDTVCLGSNSLSN